MRLDKYVSLGSIGTRNKVKEYIYKGFIEVNSIVITEPAFLVNEKVDYISYKGEHIKQTPVYYMFHKPKGCITAKDREVVTIFDYFEDIDTTGLFAVGRLDKDTEGLLLLTNDGAFNHKLMAPSHHVEKTYYFIAQGEISKEAINIIETGMDIGYKYKTKPAKIQIKERGSYETILKRAQVEITEEKDKRQEKKAFIFGEITIVEGMKHQVKRMLKKVGCPVIYLKRISIGTLILDKELKVGKYRRLLPQEVSDLL